MLYRNLFRITSFPISQVSTYLAPLMLYFISDSKVTFFIPLEVL